MDNKKIILYTLHCDHCETLAKRLKEKNIDYEINEDMETMFKMGFKEVPMLEVGDEIYNFAQALNWVNKKSPNL